MSNHFGEYWAKKARGRDFHINVVPHEDRNHAIDHCKEAVLNHRGSILDFKMFSNLSLNMIVELSGANILAAIDSLLKLGWKVQFEPDRKALAACKTKALEGTLQMTFREADGEMKVEVPAVPG